MATIKPIEGRTVHQIQSGQVIVDLCSVVKELVENSIDAGATSLDVRFKNQGLDSIEVQDNGSGISPDNYESIALKHYTSKLSTYSDLATLQTFGFRGEALSSLCALSQFSIVTCLAKDVPKGTRLEFEHSGKLKGTHVVAAQKGSNVVVENLFHNLPVRRRELERNIKREWNKVIALLNQYACIQIGVKFTVSQQPSKGKRIVLFSTKGNLTTRENLINIFGAKTMTVLVKLDMALEFKPTTGPGLKSAHKDKQSSTEVLIQGYVSRPAHGEGRQTPDRQMFFVNGRPCGLPQFAKVFNEVYRAYNASQSPFIFADIRLDTHLYDVNVSPDKRTILLHDQSRMLESLREALVCLFQSQDYSIPLAQPSTQKSQLGTKAPITEDISSESNKDAQEQGAFVSRSSPRAILEDSSSSDGDDKEAHLGSSPTRKTRKVKPKKLTNAEMQSQSLISRWVGRKVNDGDTLGNKNQVHNGFPSTENVGRDPTLCQQLVTEEEDDNDDEQEDEEGSRQSPICPTKKSASQPAAMMETPRRVLDFHARLAESNGPYTPESLPEDVGGFNDTGNIARQGQIPAIAPVRTPRDGSSLTTTTTQRSQKRSALEVTTITIGDQTVSNPIESLPENRQVEPVLESRDIQLNPYSNSAAASSSPGCRLTQMFSAAQSTREQLKQQVGTSSFEDDNPTISANRSSNELDASTQVEGHSDMAMSTTSFDEERMFASEGLDDPSSPVIAGQSAKSPGRNNDGIPDQEPIRNQGKENLPEQATTTDNRSQVLTAGIKRKDATLHYRQNTKISERHLQSRVRSWISELERVTPQQGRSTGTHGIESEDAEEILSLIISKSDFKKMSIIGQFNLGFVIAVRHAPHDRSGHASTGSDELFIIDQHASDEKYNFERLQSTTVVQSQRLVHPKQLELTALDEEIVMENIPALDVNGFKVHVDDSGDEPVGSRCKLVALPMSRETTFTLSDLEELIALLGDHHSNDASTAPRPSKVRSMFAMRACRSSVMIGKALAQRQMEKLVRQMGELDKPWNCPHGRPTMRHLSGLGSWDEKTWKETEPRVNWAKYCRG